MRALFERIKQFGRAAASSVAATIVDYGLVILLVEALRVWYIIAVIVGALLGAVTSFWLCSHWVFAAQRAGLQGEARSQMVRFALIYSVGIVFFVGLVYLLTDGLGMHYLSAKIISGACLFAGWNYPLQRRFVFTVPDARRSHRKRAAAVTMPLSPASLAMSGDSAASYNGNDGPPGNCANRGQPGPSRFALRSARPGWRSRLYRRKSASCGPTTALTGRAAPSVGTASTGSASSNLLGLRRP